jgi:hypothetical protein
MSHLRNISREGFVPEVLTSGHVSFDASQLLLTFRGFWVVTRKTIFLVIRIARFSLRLSTPCDEKE